MVPKTSIPTAAPPIAPPVVQRVYRQDGGGVGIAHRNPSAMPIQMVQRTGEHGSIKAGGGAGMTPRNTIQAAPVQVPAEAAKSNATSATTQAVNSSQESTQPTSAAGDKTT